MAAINPTPLQNRSQPTSAQVLRTVAEARERLQAISREHHQRQDSAMAAERVQRTRLESSLDHRSKGPGVPSNPSLSDAENLSASIKEAEGRKKVIGLVSRIMFEKEGYYIFRMQPSGTSMRSDELTVKGHGINLKANHEVVAMGEEKLEKSERFGAQRVIDSAIVYEVIPTTRRGIQRLLENGYVKGIGPAGAKALCDAFDRHLFDVAEHAPERLYASKVVPSPQITALVNTILEKREIPRLMSYLAEVGLGIQTSHKVLKELGPGAVDRIRKNPYELMRVPSIGFKKADEVARQQGDTFDSDLRITAGMEAVLQDAAARGNTIVEVEELKRRLDDKLAIQLDNGYIDRIDPAKLSFAVEKRLKYSHAFLERQHATHDPRETMDLRSEHDRVVSLSQTAGAERRIAVRIAALAAADVTPQSRGASLSGPQFARLSSEQQNAVRTSLTSTVSVITGRPGCGKTTVTKALVESMVSANLNVMLMGPTNRAAKQLTDATGQRAQTLHKGLGCQSFNVFEFGPNRPLECDVVIVDEKSMVGTRMMDRLMSAMRPGMCFIMVGDINQLASIDAGQILADVIKSDTVPVSYLTEIRRTGKNSSINPAAHRICDRLAPLPPKPGDNADFSMVEVRSARFNAPDAERARTTGNQVTAIVNQFKRYMDEGFKAEDIQILTPQRQRSPLGANELNKVMKSFLNPTPPNPRLSVTTTGVSGRTFSVGDRVMYTSNDPHRDIYNGDIGYVRSLHHDDKIIAIDFDAGPTLLEFSELKDIDHAFVNTVHKMQGGESPAIIFVAVNEHENMLGRELIYTGITRGKQRACIIGDTHRLQELVEKPGSEARQTMLDDELVRAFSMLNVQNELTTSRRPGMRP